MSALDKVLSLAGQQAQRHDPAEDPAGELVLAAMGCLEDLRILLAADDSDDTGSPVEDEDDEEPKGKSKGKGGGGAHGSHSTYKKLVAKGMNPKMAASMCAKADNKVSASMLVEGAIAALSGLDSAEGNWVELTAFDPLALALSGDGASKPYGDVEYADPGYRDGKKRYPIDEKHIHAAIAYFSKAKNRAEYTASQVKAIWGKIRAAAKKHGVEMADSTASATAAENEYLAFAAKMTGDGGIAMSHGPFTGTHAHGHRQTVAHSHPHTHFGDNYHDAGPSHRAAAPAGANTNTAPASGRTDW